MTDLAVIGALIRAQDGDFGHLADLIERGIPLDEPTRVFLAAYLRGKVKWPKGRRRTLRTREQDGLALAMVRYLGICEKIMAQVAAEAGRKYRAKGGETAYLELHPSLSDHTLKTMLARARRDARARVRK